MLGQDGQIADRMQVGRWVDINKGDEGNPDYRSRLVAKEINKDRREGLFAATPPLECLKFILSSAQTERRRHGRIVKVKILVLDVSRAHFHPPAVREVYVDLPPEDHEEGMVGLLLKTMYGTLDAAEQWSAHYTRTVEAAGFKAGAASPCHTMWGWTRGYLSMGTTSYYRSWCRQEAYG